jgi:FAD/FMN-containing dehydrogenase
MRAARPSGQAEEDRQGHRGQARRDAGREGRGRAVRPEEVWYALYPWPPAWSRSVTFAFKHDGVDPLGQYEPLKNAIQQAFVDSGGTLSHHHAVGTEHAAWLEQDISAPGVHMIEGLFSAMDPNSNFNPGKIIAK